MTLQFLQIEVLLFIRIGVVEDDYIRNELMKLEIEKNLLLYVQIGLLFLQIEVLLFIVIEMMVTNYIKN
jgi:hypothetical protein